MNSQFSNDQLQILYNEIVNSKIELKTVIEASEARLLMTVESLNEKIRHLEKENQNLKSKVEILERNSKKNGILVFGLKKRVFH